MFSFGPWRLTWSSVAPRTLSPVLLQASFRAGRHPAAGLSPEPSRPQQAGDTLGASCTLLSSEVHRARTSVCSVCHQESVCGQSLTRR